MTAYPFREVPKWERVVRQVLNRYYRAKLDAASSVKDFELLVTEAARDLLTFGASFAHAIGGDFNCAPEPIRSDFLDGYVYAKRQYVFGVEPPGLVSIRCCAKRFVPSRFEWNIYLGADGELHFVITQEVPESLDRYYEDLFQKQVHHYQ